MKYARIENDTVVEVSDGQHQTHGAPELVWMEAPADVEQGWILDGGTLRAKTVADEYTEPEYIDMKKEGILKKYKSTVLAKWTVEDLAFAALDATTPAERAEMKDDIIAVRTVAIQGWSDMNGATTYAEADTIFDAIPWPVI